MVTDIVEAKVDRHPEIGGTEEKRRNVMKKDAEKGKRKDYRL